MNSRQIPHPRGKVLGGSSAINFCANVYPSKANFEAWKALGNDGWDAAGLAPYFRKYSRFTPPSPETKELLNLTMSTKRYMARLVPYLLLFRTYTDPSRHHG